MNSNTPAPKLSNNIIEQGGTKLPQVIDIESSKSISQVGAQHIYFTGYGNSLWIISSSDYICQQSLTHRTITIYYLEWDIFYYCIEYIALPLFAFCAESISLYL